MVAPMHTTTISLPAIAPARATAAERAGAAIVSAGCLSLLIIGASLHPEAQGHGTHTQLGLPACGWLLATGLPCPTCGMTTAFACVCNGEFARGLLTQPGGAMFAIGVSAAFWLFGHIALTGSRLTKPLGTLLQPRALWIIGAAWLVSWIYTLITWKSS